MDSVVLGGTSQDGNKNTEDDQTDLDGIMKRCLKLMPSLKVKLNLWPQDHKLRIFLRLRIFLSQIFKTVYLDFEVVLINNQHCNIVLECIYCFYLQLNIRYYLKCNCMFSILEYHITTCLESWLNTSVALMALTRRHLKVERSWGRDIPITSVVISPHVILLCVAFQMKIIW